MPDPALPETFYYPVPQNRRGTTYFVRTDGNDANTGLGYTADLAWRSLKKAMTTIASGDTVVIGPGTYAETSGSGFWTISQSFASPVLFRSYTLNPDDVIITGTTNNSLNTFISTTANGIKFQAVTFQSFGAAGASAVRITAGQNITFVGCKFLVGASTLNGYACILATVAAASTIDNLRIIGCTITNGLAVTTAYGTLIQGVAGSVISNVLLQWNVGSCVSGPALYVTPGPVTNLTIDGCTYSSTAAAWGAVRIFGNSAAIVNVTITGGTVCTGTYAGLEVVGIVTNLAIQNGTFSGGSGYGLRIGQDGTTAGAITGFARSFTASATTGHGVLIGGGADGVLISDGVSSSSGLGFVFKEVTGAQATRMTVTGGTDSGVTFKAATNCSFTNSTVNEASGYGLQIIKNVTTGNKSSGNTVTGCTFNISGTGTLDNILGATDDNGGDIINYNTYHMTTGATHPFGTVYGTASLDNLAAVQAAWAGYNVPSNDSRSLAT